MTKQQFLALGEQRWRSAPYVAYNLLDVGENPTADDIQVFESLSFALMTSNGTTRTTFRNRFHNLDSVANAWVERFFSAGDIVRVEDRAVSNGLTSVEWATSLLERFPRMEYEASDLMIELLELTLDSSGVYITEADGTPLQFIQAPNVTPLNYAGARRYVVNRWIAGRALRRLRSAGLPEHWYQTESGPGYRVHKIPFIHPEAVQLMRREPRFQFCRRSIFDRTPVERACHVMRTMNILNFDYFPEQRLREAIAAISASTLPGGLWVVGRTLQEDFSNHASLLRRNAAGWELLERIGNGSEVESLALGAKYAQR